jgi:hypothetical protein
MVEKPFSTLKALLLYIFTAIQHSNKITPKIHFRVPFISLKYCFILKNEVFYLVNDIEIGIIQKKRCTFAIL